MDGVAEGAATGGRWRTPNLEIVGRQMEAVGTACCDLDDIGRRGVGWGKISIYAPQPVRRRRQSGIEAGGPGGWLLADSGETIGAAAGLEEA